MSELDLAIITEPSENSQLTQVQLATQPLSVVLPADHPATAKPSVSVADLGGVGWMVFPRKAHPVVYDRLMEEARVAGISPVELHHYVSLQETAQLIAENFGVAFAAKGIAEQLRGQGMAVRPLSQPSLQLRSYLVLLADQSSRLVSEFGRAFLRKVLPQSNPEAGRGQLLLKL